MEHVTEPEPKLDEYRSLARAKRSSILAALGLSALWAVATVLLPENSIAIDFVDTAVILITWGIVIAWCHYDAIQRNLSFTGMKYVLLFIGLPIMFFLYIALSRGWRAPLTLLGVVGIVVLYCATYSISELLTLIVTGTPFTMEF